jgi:hypothetical protein
MWARTRLATIRVAINKSSALRVMSGAFDDSQSLISLVKNLLPSSIPPPRNRLPRHASQRQLTRRSLPGIKSGRG